MIRCLIHIIACLSLITACKSDPKPMVGKVVNTKIILQDSVFQASTTLEVNINSEKEQKGQLIFSGAWGSKSMEVILNQGNNTINLPLEWTKWSGEASMRFTSGWGMTKAYNIEIIPLKPVDPMEVYTGPKTIWNNRKQSSMIVSVPRDSLNNVVKTGTSVNQQFKYPEGNQYKHSPKTKHLMAATEFKSFKNSGDIYIGSSGEGTHANEQKVEVVPSWPNSLAIEIVDHVPYADNRHFAEVRTKPLMDDIGNKIPDGTLVQFNIITKEGTYSMYRAFAIDGIASTMIKNPSYSTLWEMNATVGNVLKSNTIKLFFDSPLKRIKYSFDKENRILKVGPLVSYLGQYVSDGTEVFASFNSVFKQTPSEAGFATFNLDELALHNDTIALKILVADKEIKTILNLSNE